MLLIVVIILRVLPLSVSLAVGQDPVARVGSTSQQTCRHRLVARNRLFVLVASLAVSFLHPVYSWQR